MAEAQQERRKFLTWGMRGACTLALGGLVGWLTSRAGAQSEGTVWQIDPFKCAMCDKCATACVLTPSAVKCVQEYAMCGYCDLCPGYFEAEPNALNTGAENQLCPTGAIKRTFVEDPYYEYTIDESLCIGCAKCVIGCLKFGNASFYLQIRHDRCQNCNECAIAQVCPTQAISRVPAKTPYLLKNGRQSS